MVLIMLYFLKLRTFSESRRFQAALQLNCNTNDKRRIIHFMQCKEYSYRQYYRRLLSKTMVFRLLQDTEISPHNRRRLGRDPFTIFAANSEMTHSLLLIRRNI